MRYAIILFAFYAATVEPRELFYYLDFEHPNLTYYNPKYYAYLNFSARRISRRDPIHYVSVHSHCLTEFDNEVLIDAWVFQFLSNEYRPSFIEFHSNLCDLLRKEKVFVPHIMKFLSIKFCPFPKGEYHYVNMHLPSLPILRTFPFTKGRLFVNASNWKTGEPLLQLFIDVAIIQKLQ